MCSLARPSALGFDATAFLDRRQGVAAAAPAACCVMARREPARRAGVEASSSAARTQKRARESLEGEIAARKSTVGEVVPVIPAQGQQRLQERMKEELDTVRTLHRKAVVLCRGAGRSGAARGSRRPPDHDGRSPRRWQRRGGKRPHRNQRRSRSKEAVKQQRPAQRAAPPSAKEDAQKRQRMEEKEIARAREECRQQMLEAERAALPNETVYPHDLEELGIAPFEHVVTRTRSQARCGDPR